MYRESAEIAAQGGLGEAHGLGPGRESCGEAPARPGPALGVAVNDEQALVVVVQVEAVARARTVGGEIEADAVL